MSLEKRRKVVERNARETLAWLLEHETRGFSIVRSLRLQLGSASAWGLYGLAAELRSALAERGYSGSGRQVKVLKGGDVG